LKFKLKQEKLEDLLEKLMLKDVFVSSVISTKDKNLFSIQQEDHGRAMRFLSVKESFFEEIDESVESIELNIAKTLSIVKNILPNTMLTFETKGNKVSITGKNVNANISYEDPKAEVKTELPFEIKDGVPLIGKEKIPLTTYLTVKLTDFKDIAGYANSLDTEFYKFSIEDKKIISRVGDLHDFSDYVIFTPDGEIKTGEDLNVILTYGVPQVAGTFHNTVHIKTATNSPAWFFEGTAEYTLGVLVPPYVQE